MRPSSVATLSYSMVVAGCLFVPAATSAPAGRPQMQSYDTPRRIDVNRINMFVTNFGSFGFDIGSGAPGLLYPRGETKTALFAGGLWLAAESIPGSPRVALAEYSMEYGPGKVIAPGFWEDRNTPDLVVYKVQRWTGDPADSAHIEVIPADPTMDPLVHHGWAEYMAGAASRGAPVRMYRLPQTDTPAPDDSVEVPGPDVAGDLMLWSVYNDVDPSLHTSNAGSTAPIGVEVQQTVFGFDRPGPLGDAVFIRYRIINVGTDVIDRLDPGVWTDPDIGSPLDDLMGADSLRNMGYVYAGAPIDEIYDVTPPALGVRLLSGPVASCTGYINGADPQSADEIVNVLRGLHRDGTVIEDPVAQTQTRFMFPGNPVTGAGWLDGPTADKRLLVSASDAELAPGDTIEILVAVVLGRGDDLIDSISELRCNADFVATAHASGFAVLDPPPGAPPCAEPSACPRPLSFWQQQCTGGGLPEPALQGIAQAADAQSEYFSWNADVGAMCAVLQSSGDDLRSVAEREYAALLASVMASRLGIPDADGQPIILSPLTPTNCPSIDAITVGDLVTTGYRGKTLTDVFWNEVNLDHLRAMTGVDFGLPHFNGGAGFATEFLGSTLDPVAQPDSFSTVLVNFSTVPQKAYRYLRHERASDGSPPPGGRRYTYAGFHDVPILVMDSDRGVQLDVAFVERVLTADDGTILPPELQPATFDSTWAPDFSETGGREYLVVLRPVYTGLPDPAFEVDGKIVSDIPALYALAARLRFEDSVADPGDHIVFDWIQPSSPGIDQMLINLESQPLEDPDVQAAYSSIVSCLQGLKDACDIPTPVLASLVDAVASPEGVDLRWYAPGVTRARVQRSPGGDTWTTVADLVRDGLDMIAWSDRNVVPGERYGYRLADERGQVHGETWVEVPSAHRLSLAGTQPNPAGPDARVVLSLRRRTAARLDVLDVAGRRVASREVGELGPGTHVVRIEELDRLPAGVYLLRLSQDGESAIARMVRIR